MRFIGAALCLLLACAPALRGQHIGDVATGMRAALATSAGESFLGTVQDAVGEEMDRLAPDLAPERRARLDALVERHFGAPALTEALVARLTEKADPARVAELLVWLPTPEAERFRQQVETHQPTRTLDQFVEAMHASRPAEERVDAVLRFVEAQHAGSFYVLAETAVREAVYVLLDAAGNPAPLYTPRTEAQLMELVSRYSFGALLSYLHRFEPIPTELIDSVAERYESSAGQSYVEVYTMSVAEVIRAAADAAAAELGR